MTDENAVFLSLLLCLCIQSIISCFFGELQLFLLSCSVALITCLSRGFQSNQSATNKRNSTNKVQVVLTWRFYLTSSKYWQNMITPLCPRIFPAILRFGRELVAHRSLQPVLMSQSTSVVSLAVVLVNIWQIMQTYSLLKVASPHLADMEIPLSCNSQWHHPGPGAEYSVTVLKELSHSLPGLKYTQKEK